MDNSDDIRDYSSVHEYCVYYFVCTEYGGCRIGVSKISPQKRRAQNLRPQKHENGEIECSESVTHHPQNV